MCATTRRPAFAVPLTLLPAFAAITLACSAEISDSETPETGAPSPGTAPPLSRDEALDAMREDGEVIEDSKTVEKAPSYSAFYLAGPDGDYERERTGLSPSTHTCMVDRMGGAMANGGGINLLVLSREDGSGSEWVLSASNRKFISATCATLESFRGPEDSIKQQRYTNSVSTWGWDLNQITLDWTGDSFQYLTGSQGKWMGTGEAGWVTQPAGSENAMLFVDTGQWLPTFSIWSSSLFVGVPGENKRVKLIGYRDGEYVRGTSASSGTFEYAVSTVSGYQSFWMSPRDRGICAITHVQGKFDQFTHYVDYSAKDTQWYGTIQSSHAANAKFRCMAFDQR